MRKEHQSFYKHPHCRFISVFVASMLLCQIHQVNGITCGQIPNFFRPNILDGSQVLPGEWPFIAALRTNELEFFCGGTIISNRHILTAAHCIKLKHTGGIYSPDDIKVQLGAYSLRNDTDFIFNVSEIYVHPEWDTYEEQNEAYDADIAIIVLSDNVTFTNSIQPICLPSDDDSIDSTSINITGKIVGWGAWNSSTYEDIPRQATIKTLNDSYCYRKEHVMVQLASARTFCSEYGDGSPAKGDSGSGFFVLSNSGWVQYGIISASSANRTGHVDKNSISLHTNVKSYKNWMENVMKSEPVQKDTSKDTSTSTSTRTRTRTTTQGSVKPRKRISVEKCNEYADLAYNETFYMERYGILKVSKVSTCAFAIVPLIVGGVRAVLREFPHMALIGLYDGDETTCDCSGTLISDQFVLSAAHCFMGRGKSPKYVRLGEYDLSRTDDGTAIDFTIIDVIVHKNAPLRTYNDIVLLKLDRKVDFNHAIRPACLPEQSAVPRHVSASGWGNVEARPASRSETLLKVELTTFSQNEWSDLPIWKWLNEMFDGDTMVLAGHFSERKDTCAGDTGAPIQILHETHYCTYIALGVTSASSGDCGTIGNPSVYTKVYSHLDWIEETVWPNEYNEKNWLRVMSPRIDARLSS